MRLYKRRAKQFLAPTKRSIKRKVFFFFFNADYYKFYHPFHLSQQGKLLFREEIQEIMISRTKKSKEKEEEREGEKTMPE